MGADIGTHPSAGVIVADDTAFRTAVVAAYRCTHGAAFVSAHWRADVATYDATFWPADESAHWKPH